jgi:hypothetical protein
MQYYHAKSTAVTLLLCLNLALIASPALAGFRVGNGGDLIECSDNPASEFRGRYSLDWLATYRKSNANADLIPERDWQTILSDIGRRLAEVAPEAGARFENYRQLIYNQDPSKKRIWEEASFGLVDVKDEQLSHLLPRNCLRPDGKLAIIQAVIRTTSTQINENTPVFYRYSPDAIQSVHDRPLQISFLMVHEFLWDLSNDVQRNRSAVRYLHSKSFFEDSIGDVRMALQNLGVRIFQKPRDEKLKIVDAGHLASCVLGTDSFECWGSFLEASTAKAFNLLPDPGLWAVGSSHICAVKDDMVECHSHNLEENGEINGAPYMQFITSISSGDGFSCATHQEGVSCWGEGSLGQTRAPSMPGARLVDSASGASCASDGKSVRCWSSTTGIAGGVSEITTQNRSFKSVQSLHVAGRHACALDSDASLSCWGDVSWMSQNPLRDIRLAAVGDEFTCVVTNAGRLVCMAKDSQIRSVPSFAAPIEDISGGSFHVCAASLAEIKCWGSNQFRQLNIPESVQPK